MSYFLRLGAYILHPLLMPLLGVLLYFFINPRYTDNRVVFAKIIAISIVTVIIPMVIFFLLKSLRWIKTLELKEVSERRIPLFIQCLLLLLIIKRVFGSYQSPEMYYFFVGVLFSSITATLLALFRVKVSLHQMGVAGVLMFTVILSVHFQVNLLFWISLLLIGNGWVASSRLYTKSHTIPELIMGFFIGVIPQLSLLTFWL